MMIAEHAMHFDNVPDDVLWQHDVQIDIAKFLVVAVQVVLQTAVQRREKEVVNYAVVIVKHV